MFEVTVRGKTLEDLKSNLTTISNELIGKIVIETPDVAVDKMYAGGQDVKRVEPVAIPAIPTVAEQKVEPVAAPTATPDVDSQGIKWDKRIHSSSKALVKSGAWKKRKGVDAAEYDAVMAELKGQSQPVEPVAIPAIPSAPEQKVEAPVATPPAPMVPGGNKFSFETFKTNIAKILTDLLLAGKIDSAYLQTLCEYFQVPVIWEVASDEAKTKELFDKLVEFNIIEAA